MKKIISAILVTFVSLTMLNALPYFSGFGGLITDISHETGQAFKEQQVNVSSFFSGQFDFDGKAIVRSELYVSTTDFSFEKLFENPGTNKNAMFFIQELSATFFFKGANTAHYLSAFIGNFEPIGNDIFLQRQFGISPIGSFITQSWYGLNGASVFPFSGKGFSYVVRFNQPYAAGLYLYDTNVELSSVDFNVAARFATVLPFFTFDSEVGLIVPIKKENGSGNKVIMLVETLQLKAGINMLVGNKANTCFYMQFGFDNIELDPKLPFYVNPTFDLKNIYFLIEPRLRLHFADLYISLFNFSTSSAKEMLYLYPITDNANDNILGANITYYMNNLYVSNTNFIFGFHVTYAVKDFSIMAPDFSQLMNLESLSVAPFVTLPVMGGQFDFALRIAPMKVISDWMSCYDLTVGFKTKL